MKSWLFYPYARYLVWREYRQHHQAKKLQLNLLRKILLQNRNSEYGRRYQFQENNDIEKYQKNIPLIHYEDILSYIDKIKQGQQNILSTNPIVYLLETSGTSAGSKYIPITKEGISHQIQAAKKLLCLYAVTKGNADFITGKMLFLQGSPVLNHTQAIPSGRLSGIVYHHVPSFFLRNRLPSYDVNIISDWQEKIKAIAHECTDQNITVFGGIPPWCVQFFELLCSKENSPNLLSLFPNLQLYIYGGVDFRAYKSTLSALLSPQVDMMQTFPASEGFFAIQDKIGQDDMLLLLCQGSFYEFIPVEDIESPYPKTQMIHEVEIGKNYELVITNNSGLYRYRMGDIIRCTSICPYRIQVVGRTSQFISAFGEHVIGYEVERTMESAIDKYHLEITDYHLSPNINERRYEWRIEWKKSPKQNLSEIASYIDQTLSTHNKYYRDLIAGNIIAPSVIISLKQGTFETTRNKIGKSGGQNKVIRISNTADYATILDSMTTY